MKILVTTMLISILLLSCKNEAPKTDADSKMKDVAKEIAEMKSYIVEYKQITNAEGMKISSIIKQYIDMNNNLSVMETETSTEIMGKKSIENSIIITDENWTYIINLKQKTGMKMKNDKTKENPMEMIKSGDDQTFRQMIEKEGGKILNNKTFLGKDCIVVEMKQENQLMKMWYYKGIPLKMESNVYTMEATKFEENASIPASKFEVPKDITFSEMPNL